FKTDRTASGIADFGNGRQLTFTVSTQTAPYQRAQIAGTKGRIEVEIPFNAPPDVPNRLFIQGMEMNRGQWRELPVSDQYQMQAEAFGRVIRKKERLKYGIDDAIQNMKIIDAFFRSAKSGKWEKP
ncbi:MAG: gfo/Idh/MocA family oxidoreductase, partial [Rhizobiales bacterium]|nr:gfo/Idh/MocA family oxidoreductase [Hyphomicrobiales bacterium]